MEYRAMPGVAGQYFDCDKYRATLSIERCAAMFREVRKLPLGAVHRHDRCAGCALGALHAGERAPVAPVAKSVCVRCHQPSLRMVGHALCVTCFNREREVLRGRNAKGVPPKPADRWFGAPVGPVKGKGKTVFIHEVRVSVEGRVQLVSGADMLEVLLRKTRELRTAAVFARPVPAARPAFGQLPLFGVF